ncbi:MAG: serine/threonine-protein kinase, partial [Myxococcota bacterium]
MALPTKTLGPYGLGELIAVGGMARTYRAWRNNESDFPLCIKLLHGELGENIDFIKMFIDEATIAQSLKHPNVVRVYELGRSDENHYIVMELVEGKDLKQIAERASRRGTRMTPMMVAATIHDICRALSYVHNKTDDNGKPLGIIHRDVSPHNIMLTFEGARVKLTDFGIAKAASRLTRTRNGAVKGKYGYMSP